MAKQDYEIVITASDRASPVIEKVQQRFSGLAGQLRQGGDIGDIGAVKRVGKNLGEFFDLAGTREIKSSASDLRTKAAQDYAGELKKAADIEREASTIDKYRTQALVERSQAAARLHVELKEIDKTERRDVRKAVGRAARDEVRDEANINREAADRAYQEVIKKTADIEQRALVTDKQRADAIMAKRAATIAYAKQLEAVNKAEAEARKEALKETRVSRGLAAAGGVLLAVKAVGELAKAYDVANQKLEKGEITAGMFAGEMAKAVPIIGGVVQSAETLLMVVSGTAKAMREANAEAAKLDQTINGQNETRKGAKDIANEFGKLNQSDKGKILSEAKERLGEIAKLREQAKANNTYNQVEGDLNKAEADAIKKRETDLAAVEAREREARAKQIEGVEDRLAGAKKAIDDQRTQDTIASLKEQGKELAAAELQIRSESQAKRDALDKERDRLQGEKGLSDQQRIAINNSIDAQKAAINQSEAFQVAKAKRDLEAENMSTFEKFLDSSRVQRRVQEVGQSAATDARFSSGVVRQADAFRNDQRAAADTAKSTKDTAEGVKKLFDLGTKLIDRLKVVRLT